MYHGKTTLIARQTTKPEIKFELLPLSFEKLPLANDWMPWAIYTRPEDDPEIISLKKNIQLYNEAVDAINNYPGLKEEFVKNGLCLSREQILSFTNETVTETIFSIRQDIFTPSILIRDNCLLGRCKSSPEYAIDVPLQGTVFFTIDGYNEINYRFQKNERLAIDWNFSDDARDFSFSLWEELYDLMPDFDDDIDDESDDVSEETPSFSSYEVWDQGRSCIDEPDKRLTKCLDLLETYGYLWTYSVKPETPHYCWYNTDKTDASLDFMVLDRSFRRDQLILEKIKLVLASAEIYYGKDQFFTVDSAGTLRLGDTKGTLGGHSGLKIYGRLDCPSAARYIAKGQYIRHRVFFKDEGTAISAGYRPCGVCMKEAYKAWKEKNKQEQEGKGSK